MKESILIWSSKKAPEMVQNKSTKKWGKKFYDYRAKLVFFVATKIFLLFEKLDLPKLSKLLTSLAS